MGGRKLNRGRSDSEHLTMILSLKGVNLNSQQGVSGQFQIQRGGEVREPTK